MTVTSYYSCKICCGTHHGLTASGVIPLPGRSVAASRSIPFGTKLIIQNHKYVVEDRLAKRFDSRVDIFMRTHKEARKFGKQVIQVKIITKG